MGGTLSRSEASFLTGQVICSNKTNIQQGPILNHSNQAKLRAKGKQQPLKCPNPVHSTVSKEENQRSDPTSRVVLVGSGHPEEDRISWVKEDFYKP